MVDRKAAKDRLNSIMIENQPEQHKPPLLFYLSDYRYGGCTTFTAHLLHVLNRKYVLCLTKAFDKDIGDFGYGIKFQRKPIGFLDKVKRIFIADMFENFHLLKKIEDKDVTIVVHDPGEIFNENERYLKRWNIVVIRKAVQAYLKRKYDLNAKFLYHPFYPCKKSANGVKVEDQEKTDHHNNDRKEAVSISRVEPHKNIDMILRANKKLNNPIKIYGFFNPSYVFSSLKKLDFDKHYHGMFDKSFSQVSAILSKSKFMVDLSEIPNDGGGTQYTFLEAIYNNSAVILNRKWIESVDKKYSDFEEGYNCYAVSNEQELIDLINNGDNVDTTKVVRNAGKLMHRHIDIAKEWANLINIKK